MRNIAILIILLTASQLSLAEPRPGPLKRRTLTPAKRLALPWFQVAVGPDAPLHLQGRERPVAFEVRDGVLFVDADLAPGCETAVTPRTAVPVHLAAGDPPKLMNLLFIDGSADRGEPAWSVVNLDVLAGRIGREKVLFVDHDSDGDFLTPYRDFLVPEKKGAPHPVAPVVVHGRDPYSLVLDRDAPGVTATKATDFRDREVFPKWTDVVDGLGYLNEIRRDMNIPPVALDPAGTRAALLHINYLERNGGNGHVERADFPGYTREGAMAGLNSIGHIGGGSVRNAIDGHLSSLLHRMDLIDPRLTRIGIAAAGSRIWINTECGEKRGWEGQPPVIFPGPNRKWKVGVYSMERPDPRPETAKGTSGLPITVAWYGAKSRVRKVRAELRTGSSAPRCWKNDADGRDLKTNHAAIRALIMTIDTLKGGRHRLLVTWEQAGHPCRLEYDFKIGR